MLSPFNGCFLQSTLLMEAHRCKHWSTILHTPQSTFFTPALCKQHMYNVHCIVHCANCLSCANNTCVLCKLLSVWFFLSTALDLFCCSASLAKPAKELESSRFTIFTLISKQYHENHHFHQRLFESGTLVKETNQLHFLVPLRSQLFLGFHRHYL